MDVVRSNFEEVFPQIEISLEKCDFIAIDTEFTGLGANENQRPSLFDSPCERYKKLKRMVSQFLVCQFGISAFVKSQEYPNLYEAHTYNFHIFPSSFGQMDVRFMCQASSLEFLCNHKFDYNKFVYEGIPYLNKVQRAELQELCLKDQVRIASTIHKDIERDFIIPQCNRIDEWLKENKSNTLEIECQGAFLQFLLYQEIHEKFDNLACEVQIQGKVSNVFYEVAFNHGMVALTLSISCVAFLDSLLVKRVGDWNQPPDYKEQIEKIVNQACGFTRVFDMLVELKKPLVGHNSLTDVLFMYEKFHNTLPDDYANFKKNIHQLFPHIIDTKRIAFALTKHEMLRETDLFKKTSLEELYTELSCHKGLYYVLYTPTIVHSKSCQKYVHSHSVHEAGYDAYISGYVFLRMAHILTAKTFGSSIDGPLEFRQYFEAIQAYGNMVNISRAAVPFVNFSGEDPQSTRPPWLHVSRRHGLKTLTAGQILKELDRFGSLDVKLLDSKRAVVATGHSKVAKRILAAFRRHKQLKVREYYPVFDSPRVRTFFLAGGLTTVVTLLLGGIAALYCGKQKLTEELLIVQ